MLDLLFKHHTNSQIAESKVQLQFIASANTIKFSQSYNQAAVKSSSDNYFHAPTINSLICKSHHHPIEIKFRTKVSFLISHFLSFLFTYRQSRFRISPHTKPYSVYISRTLCLFGRLKSWVTNILTTLFMLKQFVICVPQAL